MSDATCSATALWFSAARTVELRAALVPPPGPDELAVATLASAISHGSELLVYRGGVAAALPLDLPTLAGGYGFPIKFGYAAVGRVVELGAQVTGFALGDLVFALHPHQSHFVVPAAFAWQLPPTLAPTLGVFAANLETALGVAHDAPLMLGETAIVFGQGVVGALIGLLLRRRGAGRLIVVDPLPNRRALALRLGADAALAPGPALAEELRALNDGRLADVAVEASGVPAALQCAIDSVLADGSVVVASWYGRAPVTLDLGSHFHRSRVRIRSSQVGQLAPELGKRWDRARRRAAVAALLPTLPLAELISHRFPLARAAAAYRLADESADTCMQIVFEYDGEG